MAVTRPLRDGRRRSGRPADHGYYAGVNAFDTAAVLLAIAAACGYLNHRLLRLPSTSGTLAIALFSSIAILAVEAIAPSLSLRDSIRAFLTDIDFNQTLMRGL